VKVLSLSVNQYICTRAYCTDSKIGVYLKHPIWQCKDNGTNKDPTDRSAEEWPNLKPRNNVVQQPGGVQENGGARQPPGMDRRLEEQPETLP
jgi:hypothetical protein